MSGDALPQPVGTWRGAPKLELPKWRRGPNPLKSRKLENHPDPIASLLVTMHFLATLCPAPRVRGLGAGLQGLDELSSGQRSAALTTSPRKTTVPQAQGQDGAAVPAQPGAREGTGAAARPGAGKGERSRPNKAPGTHSSRRGRTKGAFGAAEATRPLPAPGGQSAATAASAPSGAAAPARSRDLAHPQARHAPRPPSAPSPGGASRRPFPDAPTSAGSQQWALSHAARRGLGDGARQAAPGPGAQRPHRPPASHRPPARSPAATWNIGLTFPEPARPRAPPSLCLWQTWFAEKRAPSLAAAAAATAPAAPELPLAPGPLPGARSLARSRSPRRAPLPPPQALAPRSFQLSKRQPRPRPHRPGTPPAPARPGVPVPPPPLARRPGCPLARSRARPPGSACAALCASGTAAAAAAAGLLGAQPNVATPARERAGVNVPRLIAAPANRRVGAGPGRPGGRPVSAQPRQSPLRPPPRSRCPCSRGRTGGASLPFL